MLTRREAIVAFLGASALHACRRSSTTRREVPGALVDVVARGHRLRSSTPPPRLPAASRSVDVLIVGGGAAGLSAAWRLAGAGVESMLVCELDDAWGGTARSGANATTAFPWGAHYLPAPLTAKGPVPRLLRELGALTGVGDDGAPRFAEEMLIHEPEERLFYKGQWYEGLYLRAGASEDDLAQLARFEATLSTLSQATDAKGRRAFAVPLETGSDDAEWTALDRLSMAQWLEREGFTSPRLQWLVDYACRDDYGAHSSAVSAWAGLWYFCARRVADQRSDGYLSWPEGNGRLIAQLAKSVSGEQSARGLVVHALSPEGQGWAAHAVDAVSGTPTRLFARQVILAAPRHVAGRVVEPWLRERPAFLDQFVSGPWVVANVAVSQLPKGRGFPLAWDNVLYDSKSLGYVVATHQSPRASATGPSVLTWYYPVADDDPKHAREALLESTFENWRDVVLADLSPAHPGFAETVERVDVMRWGHAMVRPVPGFLWGGARALAQQSLGGSLHFAHSDLGGLALFEEANWHGVRAAEDVLAALGHRVETWRD
ncbi:MAG: FAD-dependent oxidoreductase [Myxococcaceae bacterium]